MGARFRYLLLFGSLTLVSLGCEIEIGGGDLAAGFLWSWTVVDDGDRTIGYECGHVGADRARITVVDSRGQTHQLPPHLCGAGEGDTDIDEWEIATGDGAVTADLLNIDGEVLSTLTFPFPFRSGKLDNDLGVVEFGVATWDDPRVGADASLTWDWSLDDESEVASFDQDICDQLGVDYVALWAWNPAWARWWSDPQATTINCAAMEHPESADFWSETENTYSGLHVSEFLRAGDYQLFIGFYAEQGYDDEGLRSTGVLLYHDTAGLSGSELSGELLADGDFTAGTNRLGTVFGSDLLDRPIGALAVDLIWHNEDGVAYESCYDSEVATIGFQLRGDGWITAEVPLEQGDDCLDRLLLDRVPVRDEPYELVVSAISTSGEFLWHHVCTGLEPDLGASTALQAQASVCAISNILEN